MDGHEKQNNAPYMLFYSYVNEDEDLRNQLEKHLSLLRQQRMIVEWHHHKILPGAEKNYVSDERLSSADIILLLISPSFLASDDAYAEMQRALQLQKSGRAQVIPILLRPVENWQGAPFGKLQALPSNGTPITQWRNRDLAFVDIVKRIRAVLEQSDGSHHQVLPPVLFLSSARKDLPLIKRLKDDLHAHGLLGLIDDRAFQSGSSEKEDLREVIRNASAVVLVASPHTRRSRLVKEELHIADMYLRSIYVFWTQGNLLTEVIPTGWSHLRFFDARAERYTQAFQDLLQTTRAQTSSFSPIVLDGEYSPPLKYPRNPFKGLQAFRAEDARDFFGRDRLIDELLEEIQQVLRVPPSNIIVPRVLTVLGSSGSGKSSVVMAGLLPQLKQGMFPGSRDWIYPRIAQRAVTGSPSA